MKKRIRIGDLVTMKTHDTGFVGLVLDVHPSELHKSTQIGIKWFGGSGKIDYEPEGWLEVVSEAI